MNLSVVRFILFQVMRIEGILMLLPCAVSLIYGDGEEKSHAVGESGRTVFGITDGNFAHVIKEEIEKA